MSTIMVRLEYYSATFNNILKMFPEICTHQSATRFSSCFLYTPIQYWVLLICWIFIAVICVLQVPIRQLNVVFVADVVSLFGGAEYVFLEKKRTSCCTNIFQFVKLVHILHRNLSIKLYNYSSMNDIYRIFFNTDKTIIQPFKVYSFNL